jgi:hypothetical protein
MASSALRTPHSALRTSSIVYRLSPVALWLVACGLWLASGSQLRAQTSETAIVGLAPVFKFYVWGQVQTPGAYRLSANPDIIELLSAGGGPTEKADLNRVMLVRGIDQRRQIVNLKRMLNNGQTVTLSPGDVVVIPEAFWYRFRDEITVVTTLAVFINLYFTIANRPTQAAKASNR